MVRQAAKKIKQSTIERQTSILEMLDSPGWNAVLELVDRRALNYRKRIFLGDDDKIVRDNLTYLHAIRDLMYNIYEEAGVQAPERMEYIFN